MTSSKTHSTEKLPFLSQTVDHEASKFLCSLEALEASPKDLEVESTETIPNIH